MKDIRDESRLRDSRFTRICLSNFLLHAFVFLLIPLTARRAGEMGAEEGLTAWAVLAFAAGRFAPGPFGAHLMERRPRKHIALWAVLALGLLSLPPAFSPIGAAGLVALYGLQGVCFGLAQTALGSTLVNDVLRSHERDCGDMRYAWAGRLGMPAGLVAGALLPELAGAKLTEWYALSPCALAFLLIAQTSVPLKAPVPTAVVSLDRFLLPRSLYLSLSLFPASFVLGHAAASYGMVGAWLFAASFAAVFLCQFFPRFFPGRRTGVALGYLLIAIGQAILNFEKEGRPQWIALLLTGTGVAMVSSRHLHHWITLARHCQRGTAQSTYALSCRTAFSAGFASACFFPAFRGLWLSALCMAAMCLYFLWPCHTTAGKAHGSRH